MAQTLGIEMKRIPSANVMPTFIASLAWILKFYSR